MSEPAAAAASPRRLRLGARVLRTQQLTVFVVLALLAATSARADGARPVRSLMEFRQRNIVLQQFDLSCGAAALATILRYQHGESVTERNVAIGLISRDIYVEDPDVIRVRGGFSLLDMNRYTERLGYFGRALGNVTYDDLLDLVPAIVPIRLHGYNHFVVFRGAFRDTVVLGDPAFGNRTMSRHRFIEAWIEYADIGHVGFVVERKDGLIPPSRLEPITSDFLMLH
jgi:predicted double-glycine peptidase